MKDRQEKLETPESAELGTEGEGGSGGRKRGVIIAMVDYLARKCARLKAPPVGTGNSSKASGVLVLHVRAFIYELKIQFIFA